jgi:hypothetical protein
MQARIVAAGRGVQWLADGWRLFFAAPIAWLLLLFAYYLMVMVASLVPLLGFVAVALTTPAFSVGFMAIARSASHRARPEFAALFDGFRHQARAQIVLGAVYLVLVGLVFTALALADDGALRALLSARRARETPPPEIAALLTPLAVGAALYAPVMMLFWFAPLLVAWHGVPPLKALFFSLAGCLMNWRAALVYGAAAGALIVFAPYLLVSVLVLVSGGGLSPQDPEVLLPFMLLLLPPFYGSFYASYRDVFATPEEERAP